MELLQPVETRGDQEALHLAAAEVIDVGVPVLMISLARVLMLIQRRAVEPRQTMRIGREMCRHPVDQDADICAMAGIDETGKPLGRAEPRTGREQAEWLIPPGATEWMLGHRHQLDMREPHLTDIGHQTFRQLVPRRDPAFRMKP